jgi:hypothetical protein
MSKKISIINAGGIYAQTFFKNLRGYNQIALGDLFNNRRSVMRILLVVFFEKFTKNFNNIKQYKIKLKSFIIT